MAIIKSPLFKNITESEISEMTAAGFLRAKKFRKNSFIYHVTDIVHEIGIVASGQVTIEYIDLWGNKAIMSNITPGHVFAETYALTGEPLMVDAVASETSVILFLDMNKLMDFQLDNERFKNRQLENEQFNNEQLKNAQSNNEQLKNTQFKDTHFKDTILNNLLHISIQKNLTLSNRIFCTSPKTIRERLLIYLSNESRKAGSQKFVIPFDRQQLADYLNVDRSALSKELGKMRDEGLIEFRKNVFHLLSIC